MAMTCVQLTVCLDNGEFYPNFAGCAHCSGSDVLHVQNRVIHQDEDEETVTYERMYSFCELRHQLHIQKLDYMLFIVFAHKWYHFSSDAVMQWLCILSNSFVAE